MLPNMKSVEMIPGKYAGIQVAGCMHTEVPAQSRDGSVGAPLGTQPPGPLCIMGI